MSLEFHISQDFGRDIESVYLIDRDKGIYVTYNSDIPISIPYKEGESIKPLFEIGGRWQREWKDSLLVALVSAGAKYPEKKYLEGKIEATERHLEDMRTLVFTVTKKK